MSAARPAWVPWLERLSNLNLDRSRGAAPQKPLLLLVVLDLIEDGKLAGGLLARDGNLVFRFSSYWTIVAERRESRPDVRLPFYHIRSDGFWTPLDVEGKPAESHDRAVLAQLDVSFLLCVQDAEFPALARRTGSGQHRIGVAPVSNSTPQLRVQHRRRGHHQAGQIPDRKLVGGPARP